MATIERSITIHAPVEKVFDYLTQPTNLPEIWPSMVEVKDVKNAGSLQSTFSWVYKMAGIKFEGETHYTEFVPCQRVVAQSDSRSGIVNAMTWTYQSMNEGTRLDLHVEYMVPLPLLGKLAEQFVAKQNEHEVDTLLANLKARMET